MTIDWVFIGLLVGNLLAIMAYTMVMGDNVLSRITEHIIIGVGMGYGLAINLYAIYNRGILKIPDKPYYIIPIILIIMLYFRFYKPLSWVYRYPTAILIAGGLGLGVRGILQGQFLDQIRGVLPPISPLIGVPAGTAINNLIILVGTMVSTIYFVFSREFKGPLKHVHKLGRYFLLIAFGAAYGATVLYRYELFSGVMQTLLLPEARTYSLLFAIVVIGILVYVFKTGRTEWELT
jgi:lipoprotein signal peptidase